jgi:hypothetical protein
MVFFKMLTGADVPIPPFEMPAATPAEVFLQHPCPAVPRRNPDAGKSRTSPFQKPDVKKTNINIPHTLYSTGKPDLSPAKELHHHPHIRPDNPGSREYQFSIAIEGAGRKYHDIPARYGQIQCAI